MPFVCVHSLRATSESQHERENKYHHKVHGIKHRPRCTRDKCLSEIAGIARTHVYLVSLRHLVAPQITVNKPLPEQD